MENEIQSNTVRESSAMTNATSEHVEKKGFSIASMILGIISIVCTCLWHISIPCAILAIIFAIIGRKKGGKGMAKTGLILGITAIILTIILYALAALLAVDLIIQILTSYRRITLVLDLLLYL